LADNEIYSNTAWSEGGGGVCLLNSVEATLTGNKIYSNTASGGGGGVNLTGSPTATATFFGTKYYGKNYGLVFTAYGAGALLGGVFSGLIRDMTGSYVTVFLPVIILSALGLAIALWQLKPVQRGAS